MNLQERIDTLAKQCYSTDHLNFDYNLCTKMIVRECIDSVCQDSIEYVTRPQIINEIKDYFEFK